MKVNNDIFCYFIRSGGHLFALDANKRQLSFIRKLPPVISLLYICIHNNQLFFSTVTLSSLPQSKRKV